MRGKLLKCRACRQRFGRATVESENCCTATVTRLPLSVHRPRLTARQAKTVLRSIDVCCSIGAVATAVQGGADGACLRAYIAMGKVMFCWRTVKLHAVEPVFSGRIGIAFRQTLP